MSSEMLRQVERNIQQHKKAVELGNALERLKVNKDFKLIVSQGYFESEAIRLVHAKTAPNLQSVESQKLLDSQIQSIGVLAQYFQMVEQDAAMAFRQLEVDEATREEILAEGA